MSRVSVILKRTGRIKERREERDREREKESETERDRDRGTDREKRGGGGGDGDCRAITTRIMTTLYYVCSLRFLLR